MVKYSQSKTQKINLAEVTSMTKKLISLLTLICVLFSSCIIFAKEVASADFVYDVDGRPVFGDAYLSDEYDSLMICVEEAIYIPETNTAKFIENGITYVIDNETAIYYFQEDDYTVHLVLEGIHDGITVQLKKDIVRQIMSGEISSGEIHVDAYTGCFDAPKKDKKHNDEDLKALLPYDYVSDESFETILKYKVMQGDEKGNLNLDSFVTRAEMAQFAVNALNLSGIPGHYQIGDEFTDVGETHWALDAIMMVKGLKIVNGYGDGTFLPDNFVTYDEAVKIVVEILEYGPEAQKRGGYPDGYRDVATLIGIIGSYDSNAYIPRKDIAQMLETAFDVPKMVQVGYGSVPEYSIQTGDENGVGRVTLEDEFK